MHLHPLPPQPELNIPALERSLDLSSLTNSYKLYWFAGLLEEINHQRTEIKFKTIVIWMITKSWHTVLTFKLSLGAQDKLAEVIYYINEKYEIKPDITESELNIFLNQLHDPEFENYIRGYIRYVPYRLLSSFYEFKDDSGYNKDRAIAEKSSKDETVLYRINIIDSTVIVNYRWFEYIYCNMPIVTGWFRYKLVEYLQRRNPNVPAIIDKIELPQERILTEARQFWKVVMNTIEINDIYTNLPLNISDMSIDHFIPWSFVLHDKQWNLTPVSKRINSSKSDRLPPLEKYLDKFINQQFKAYTIALKQGPKSKVMQDYITLGQGIDVSTGLRESEFKEIMKNTIIPLHRIAQNQGFPLWK